MASEINDEIVETPEINMEELQKAILEVPSVLKSLDKISGVLDKLSNRVDSLEKAKTVKEDEEEEDKEEEDKKEKKEDLEDEIKEAKKSNDFEDRIKALESKISAENVTKSVEAPKTVKKSTRTVETVAPPAADRVIKKENTPISFLQAAASELNEKGSWKKIAMEAVNENRIEKIRGDLAMYEGIEQSRENLGSISVNTVATPINPLKRGVN